MPNLSEVINVPPKRRITIPEGKTALVLPKQLVDEIKAVCLLIRKGRRYSPQDKNAMYAITGDLLLAIVETENE